MSAGIAASAVRLKACFAGGALLSTGERRSGSGLWAYRTESTLV